MRIEIWGLDGIPEIEAGDDVGIAILRADPGLQDRDLLVVTSKVISKAEGRLVPGTRAEHLAAETVRVVASRGDTQIVETAHGFVLAAAGIDASNVPDGAVALLPVDPDASARNIRHTLRAELGVDVGVIISDTMGRPWRDGVIDTAIGAAGLDVLWDLRGQRDTAGHLLEATVIAIADELASAADLVKGKLASTPVAVIRGFPFTHSDPDRGARPLIRTSADDMFRLGTREAMRAVVAGSAPVDAVDTVDGDAGGPDDIRGRIQRAIDAVRTQQVAFDLLADGTATVTVSATDPLVVGIAVGRLLAGLAAEGLRADVQPAAGGATVSIVTTPAAD
jgi:coenzyme F420-0:L-glutamate ligase/coenzyme F420-1:gamma-L-glutamate ligase